MIFSPSPPHISAPISETFAPTAPSVVCRHLSFIIYHLSFPKIISQKPGLTKIRTYGQVSYMSHRNSSQSRSPAPAGADASAAGTGKISPSSSSTSFMSLASFALPSAGAVHFCEDPTTDDNGIFNPDSESGQSREDAKSFSRLRGFAALRLCVKRFCLIRGICEIRGAIPVVAALPPGAFRAFSWKINPSACP